MPAGGLTAGIFDQLVLAFVSAIGSGIAGLHRYMLPILGFCALVAYCSTMWPLVLAAGADALGPMLLMAIRIGVYYWLCIIFAALSFAAFDSFVQWGTVPSGGAFSAASFLNPSSLVDLGFQATRPIDDALKRMGWLTGAWLTTYVVYSIAKYVIILAFAFVALHLIMTIIEFQFSVMIGMVLFPWGILAQTAFLSEFALSWIIAGLIRVFLTVAIMSLAVPVGARRWILAIRKGGDPTPYSALIFALIAIVFAFLAWHLPKRAAQVGGKGMALAMGGELLAQGAMTAVTGGRAALSGAGGGGADWRACRAGRESLAASGPGRVLTWMRRSSPPMATTGPCWHCHLEPSEAALRPALPPPMRKRGAGIPRWKCGSTMRMCGKWPYWSCSWGWARCWAGSSPGRMHVHAFVQVVQVDDAGKVHLLGEPQAVLTYTPPEGVWLDMLGEWVRKVRWRGMDAELARQEWRWAYMHSCKDARAMLQHLEDTEKPFSLGKRKVAVQVKSVTKTEVPRAYTVLWDEVITEQAREPRVERWTGTFSVGRLPALSLDMALYNRLGLCLTAFNMSVMP